ncbi:MAG: beta strand repeat-containing protein [Burkholderiales bacterium]
MPTAEATVIITGTVNPGTLATSPTTSSQIIVSFGGSAGTLEVNANPGFNTVTGNFSGSVGVVAGSGAGSNGSILVNGNGTAGSATLTTPKSIVVGVTGGTGSLSVQNSGLVQSTNNGSLVQAGNSNSTGAITVDGANSTLKSAGRIQIGAFAGSTGSLAISNGGVAQTIGTSDGVVEMGTGTGGAAANGTVRVSGAGSKLLTNGLIVGNSSVGGTDVNTGTLTISAGALATANPLASGQGGSLFVGSKTGSQVTVTGAGSSLQVGAITSGSNLLAGKEIIVGGFGQGTLLVDQSASLNASGGNIIVGGGFFGTQIDPGALTVKNGATVTANSVTVNTNGLLNGGGGTIASDVQINGGTLAPGSSPGTMTIAGNLNLLAGALELEIASGIADHLNVFGNVSVGSDFLFDLIFSYDPPFDTHVDIIDFFSNFTSFVIDPAFTLASHLNVTGLSSSDFVTVSFGGQSVAFGSAATTVPEPMSLLLVLAGLVLMAVVGLPRGSSNYQF